MANQEHLAILEQGVEIWNQWRKEQPMIWPDLSQATLGQAYLSRADLSQAYLSRANLRGANLSQASLWVTNLNRAYLSRANLREAYLSRADLSQANLFEVGLGSLQKPLIAHVCSKIGFMKPVKKCD